MEAALLDPHHVGIRDSTHPDTVQLSLTTDSWVAAIATHSRVARATTWPRTHNDREEPFHGRRPDAIT